MRFKQSAIFSRVLAAVFTLCLFSFSSSAALSVHNADSMLAAARGKFDAGHMNDALDDIYSVLRAPDASMNDSLRVEAFLIMGNIYFVYRDYVNAIKYYERGLTLNEDAGREIKFLYNLAMSYVYSKDIDMARAYSRRLKIFSRSGNPRALYNSIVCDATIERYTGSGAASVAMFKHALCVADSFGLDRGKYYPGPMSYIASYYSGIDRPDSALYWMRRYETCALESRYPHAIADSRRYLMNYFIRSGDREEAVRYSDLYHAAVDSIVNLDRFLAVSSRYEGEREERDSEEIASLRFTVTRQQVMLAVVGILIVAAAIGFAVGKRLRGDMRQLFARNREIAMLENGDVDGSRTDRPCGQWEELMVRVNRVVADPSHFCDPDFSLNLLAGLCDSKPRYVSQAINETTGENFRALLNGYRIREARRRLTSDPRFANLTIQGVGESVGFRSTANFVNAFRKITGMTPSCYQRMVRNR